MRLERAAAGTPTPDFDDWAAEPNVKFARASCEMKVSELLLTNLRLKAQVAGLAKKMHPRNDDDDE